MNLLTINADFSLLATYLRRIAEALERAHPVPDLAQASARKLYRRGEEALSTYSEEKTWSDEQLTTLLEQLGYSDSEILHFKSHLNELPEELKSALDSIHEAN